MERRVSVEIRHGGDRGQIRSTRRIWGCVWGFSIQLFVFLLGRHLSVVSIHSTFSLSGTAFRGVGFYRNGRWGLLRWGFGGGAPFYLGRPNPRSCLLLLSNPALFFLISKGKALIQLLVSSCVFHFSITGTLWDASYDVRLPWICCAVSHSAPQTWLRQVKWEA